MSICAGLSNENAHDLLPKPSTVLSLIRFDQKIRRLTGGWALSPHPVERPFPPPVTVGAIVGGAMLGFHWAPLSTGLESRRKERTTTVRTNKWTGGGLPTRGIFTCLPSELLNRFLFCI